MTRSQLTQLLYVEPQPVDKIKDLVTSKINTFLCKNKLPDRDGDYLIYHTTYGWCIYGFTKEARWGEDDLVVERNGTRWNKVVEWGTLDFLEDEKEKTKKS